MAREATVTKLSKSILEMKFMKKTKEKVEKELEDAEGKAMYSHEITEEMKKSGANSFVYEPSFAFCEDLINGRLSFKGMNPEIERLMEMENAAQQSAVKQKETDVSDAEMAAFYNPLVNTLNKKFNAKRQRNQGNDKQGEEGQNKRKNEDEGWKKNKKHTFTREESTCGSPSVQHRDKKSKFMKPNPD